MLFTGDFLDSSLVKEKKKKTSPQQIYTVGAGLTSPFYLLFSVPRLSKSDFRERANEARRSNRFE